MTDSIKEFSAGGAILDSGKTVLILVKNLQGDEVWTFPKGHIEPGESPEEAALREVKEETGYDCEITGEMTRVNYSFARDGKIIDKNVIWFFMKKTGGDGTPITKGEIEDLKWFDLTEAKKTVFYPSDIRIMDFLEKENRNGKI